MQKITLLVIEDEIAIRAMLRFALSDDEFILIETDSIIKAQQTLTEKIPDLILLDWMLPGKTGIDFIKWIKQQDNLNNIPIIMLTAKAEEANKVKALSVGADDYITKPFSPAELIARIKAILRRGLIATPTNELKYKEIVLNTEKHLVTVKGENFSLSPIEYKMLHFFMKHPDRAYSRDQLITQIWGPSAFIDYRTVDACVKRLRNKLEKHDYHQLINTVRGIGYQFLSQ
ncbi:MAG: response regulator [Pseudomonadota bacterium]